MSEKYLSLIDKLEAAIKDYRILDLTKKKRKKANEHFGRYQFSDGNGKTQTWKAEHKSPSRK
jgi:hypothetical protein